MYVCVGVCVCWYMCCFLHMARVAEATVSRLRGTLVEAHLQIELTLMGTQLLLGEGALVLVSHLGSQSGSSEFGMLLRLFKRERERERRL